MLRVDAGPRIVAGFTTRLGGRSANELASLNLSAKAGDDPANLEANRRRVVAGLDAPDASWVQGEQAHAAQVAMVDAGVDAPIPGVDALWTERSGLALAVLVADCVPVLLADRDAGRVGVVHAGWRGLVAGVIERSVSAMGGSLAAYVGPSIGPCCYEVGDEVADPLVERFDRSVRRETGAKPHADLWRASVFALRASGVGEIGLAAACTRCEPHRFFSHRAGSQGRQALVAAVRPS